MTTIARPCQLFSILANYNRTECGLPIVVVQWTCLACSFNKIGRWAIRTGSRPSRPTSSLVGGLVGHLMACQWWSFEDACFLSQSVWSQVDLARVIERWLLGNETWSDISWDWIFGWSCSSSPSNLLEGAPRYSYYSPRVVFWLAWEIRV